MSMEPLADHPAHLGLWSGIRECKRIYAGITHDEGYVSVLKS